MMGRRSRRRDDGAAAVEFALVAPLLILLLMGIIGYGYMLSFRQSISQAAAEGARAAAVAPATANREAIAKAAVASALGVTCGSTYLACTVAFPATCTCVEVTVTHSYKADPSKPVFLGLGLVMPDKLTYKSVAEVSQ
ncbi:hypothetical protein NSZ01_09060 [Nocardioides szechwanensis]|uniref:TadE-like protein n=1 Tax=Nocardioides szechwanensis TaxID=1005944 RepID=A0A1G9UUD6_9ACTN|nr:TadE/TadG family type IV pilus assembly protein [Nocardioides szechwanensis]GEP33138.1 hypothetical protein NSZ01_09060 [Nocardioides szechwanensis]SDM63564.1 TadE-like protein [Nocardioides szechwanensis]